MQATKNQFKKLNKKINEEQFNHRDIKRLLKFHLYLQK